MTSAYASAPPPFRFGRVDLRTNARKFLERALLISALVHLSAVGVFRSMERRATAREAAVPPVRVWKRPADIFRLLPFLPGGPSVPNASKTGVFEAVDVTPPLFREFDPGKFRPETAQPQQNPGPGPGPTPPDPPAPSGDEPAFIVVDTPPVPTFAPKPVYPEWAREAGLEGNVLLRVLVGVNGIPKSVVLVRGTNGLTDAAVSAAWRWKFRAGLSNKKSVEVWVEIPFAFRL